MDKTELQEQDLYDKIHDEDLEYILSHAYTNMRFFLRVITEDSTTASIYFGDMQKNLFFVSDNMRDRFGFERNLVHNLLEKWEDCIYDDASRALYEDELRDMIEHKRSVHDMRYQVRDKEGHVFWIHCFAEIEWNEDRTKPLFFAGRISNQDECFHVDPVSNFPTDVVLQHELKRIQQDQRDCIAIGFGLNNISAINSIQGRTYGNRLIREVSDQLFLKFSGEITFYRLDGMRFVALTNTDNRAEVEEYIRQMNEIICDKYQHMGMPVVRPCSFAMMRFPQPELTPIDFLEDIIYLIEVARENQSRTYVDDSEENIDHMQELSGIEMMLSRCVMNGMDGFRAVVQPVVSSETGRIVAGETLLRWRYNGEDVSPGVFIPMLEKDVSIYEAGRWVFEQAVKTCKQIVSFLPDFYLTVNVSMQQLHDEELFEFIPSILNRYRLDGRHIVIEMTESCMENEPERLQRLVDICQRLGIDMALDDFGTGYSSMRVLLRYPCRIIKIDRSLLLEMTESEDKLNFISSIVYACHRFGKTVCIEGVETDKQNKLACESGCDLIQGFYYHRPSEVEHVLQVTRQQSAG